jgi:hypothetical protein
MLESGRAAEVADIGSWRYIFAMASSVSCSRRIEEGVDGDVVRSFYDGREVIAAHGAIYISDPRPDFLALLAEGVLALE